MNKLMTKYVDLLEGWEDIDSGKLDDEEKITPENDSDALSKLSKIIHTFNMEGWTVRDELTDNGLLWSRTGVNYYIETMLSVVDSRVFPDRQNIVVDFLTRPFNGEAFNRSSSILGSAVEGGEYNLHNFRIVFNNYKHDAQLRMNNAGNWNE